MRIILRPVSIKDTDALYKLSNQFPLLNLPADKRIIEKITETSVLSFSGGIKKSQGRFIFISEDIETGKVLGTSQVHAQAGTKEEPNYSFQILTEKKFSQSLDLEFTHKILRLRIDTDGPTELGGLLVDKKFRGSKERIGLLTSLGRFLYIGTNKDKFKNILSSELAPPLTKDGRSEFWDSLGLKFTGLPYAEADLLSRKNKDFIKNLFPKEDIYVCLLSAEAQLALGQVGEKTKPALHFLKSMGFSSIGEVDPFDGGPHFQALQVDVPVIQNLKTLSFSSTCKKGASYGLLGIQRGANFKSTFCSCNIKDDGIEVPEWIKETFELSKGDQIIFCEGSF